MSDGQTVFPYLLITKFPEVGMTAGTFAIGGLFQTDDDSLYSFLSTKNFEEINEEVKKLGKEYALVLARDYGYAHAGGKLARVFSHLK